MPTLPVQVDPRIYSYARTVPRSAPTGVMAAAFGQYPAMETKGDAPVGSRDDAQSQRGDVLGRLKGASAHPPPRGWAGRASRPLPERRRCAFQARRVKKDRQFFR